MKFISFLCLFATSVNIDAQTHGQLKLSKSLNESRMGKWVQNDFSVWIDMNELEQFCQQAIGGFVYTLNNYRFTDSIAGVTFYKESQKRYELAIEQLQKAPHGFDLRKLIVYLGPNSSNQNSTYSVVVESRVKLMLFSGNAVVYFKGKRIDSLQYVSESNRDNWLNSAICTSYYYENANNIIYKDCKSYGW
jgi:hypothetical protein